MGELILGPLDSIGDTKQAKSNLILGPADLPGKGELQPLVRSTTSGRLSEGVFAQDELESYMARQQGGWELAGKVAVQSLSEAALGTVEAVSYLGDFEQTVNWLQGKEIEYGNWLGDIMKESKESIREATNIYQTLEDREGFNPGSATWWANHSPQVLGTALSLLIPALAAGKVTSLIAKAAGASEAAAGLNAAISATVVSRYAESTMEASQVRDRALNDLLNQGVPRREAELRAGEAATKTWNSNWAFALMDVFQYGTLLRGVSNLGKGVGVSLKDVLANTASESVEEGGQFIVSEEAYRTAMDTTADYFGSGLPLRLDQYSRDPEFKASLALGALGGFGFSAFGQLSGGIPVASKAIDEAWKQAAPVPNKGDSKLKSTAAQVGNFVKDTVEKVVKKGVQKEAALFKGDTANAMGVDADIFASQLKTYIGEGTPLEKLKEDREKLLKGGAEIDERARKTIQKDIEDLDYLIKEQRRLKTASQIDPKVHPQLLVEKFTQRRLKFIEDEVNTELQGVIDEAVSNGVLNTNLTTYLVDKFRVAAYEQLLKNKPEYEELIKPKLAQAKQLLSDMVEHTIPTAFPQGLKLDEVTSGNDEVLANISNALVEIEARQEAANKAVAILSNPKNKEALDAIFSQKEREENALEVLKDPDATDKELRIAFNTTQDPKVKEALATKLKERKDARAQEKQGATETQVRDITSSPDVVEPPELNVDEIDVLPPDWGPPEGPPEGPEFNPDDFDPDTTIITKEFGGEGLTFNQVVKVHGAEEAQRLLDKLISEQPTEPKPPQKPIKKEVHKESQSRARTRGTVPVWLKLYEGRWETVGKDNSRAIADIEKLEKEKTETLKPLIEEKEQIEKEIAEIEKDTKGSEASTQEIEDTRKEISNLRNEDGSVPANKIPLFNSLSKKLRFLQKSFTNQVSALVDSFSQLNNLSERDIRILKKYVETVDFTFEEIVQELEKRNNTTYKRPEELSYFEDTSTRVDKLNESQESIDEKTNERSKLAAKELGIDLDKVYYANDLDSFVQKYGSAQTKFIWSLIKNIADKLKIPTKFLLEGKNNNIAKQHQGEYSNGQVANRASLLTSPSVAARVIVHELVHGVTSYIISVVKSNKTEVLSKLTPKQINAAKKLSNLLRELQTDSTTKDFYGSKNEHEILAELTHDGFVEALKNKKLNFVERFLDYILDILGIPTNAYNETLGILKDMIENPIDYVSEGFVDQGVYYSKGETTKLEQLKQRLAEVNKKIDDIASLSSSTGSRGERRFVKGTGYATYYGPNGEELTALDIFETSNGHLVMDTPEVLAGEEILLELVDDGSADLRFPYTATKGFRPKPNTKQNWVINGYRIDKDGKRHQKPLFQLPSLDNPAVKFQNPEGLAKLRNSVINSPTKTFKTTIASKSLGDWRTSPQGRQSNLDILEFDYYDNQGNWEYTKLPHKPVIILAKEDGKMVAPNMEYMNGMTAAQEEKINEALQTEGYSPGAAYAARTAPDGSIRLALLDSRKLNQTEIDWVKERLVESIQSPQQSQLMEELTSVLHIPTHYASWLTGTRSNPIPGIVTYTQEQAKRRKTARKDQYAENLHLVYTTKGGAELLFKVHNRANGWVVIKATGPNEQLSNFMAKRPFNFDVISENGQRYQIENNSEGIAAESLNNIYKSFEELLQNSFRNHTEPNLNNELPYTDPVTGTTYNEGYYEYLLSTNSLTTDLRGSNVMASGEDASYSFDNAGIHLDPNAGQVEVHETDDEIETIVDPTPQPEPPTSTPSSPDEDAIDEYYGYEGKTRPAVAKGFQVVTEKEITWFKERFGDEYLTIVQDVDRILAKGGVEAFGVYHNAMVTLADLAETGTLYHEGMHIGLDALPEEQKQKVLEAASKIYGIERSYDAPEGSTSPSYRAVSYQEELDRIGNESLDHYAKEFSKAEGLGFNPNTPTTTEVKNLDYTDYFKRRYDPVTRYTGPRNKKELAIAIKKISGSLKDKYAAKFEPHNRLETGLIEIGKLPIPGDVIPITLRFLENIKNNPEHSTSLSQPFKFKNAKPKENEALQDFYDFLMDELKTFSEREGRKLPKSIKNERLVEKLQEWLNDRYRLSTYDAPVTDNPYGLYNAIDEKAEISGNEVFISDGLHFPNLAWGHNKKLGNSEVRSNTLAWFIEAVVKNEEGVEVVIYYEFQSDIIPEVHDGDFRFSIEKVVSEEGGSPITKYNLSYTAIDFAESRTIVIDNNNRPTEEELATQIRENLTNNYTKYIEYLAGLKITSERYARGDTWETAATIDPRHQMGLAAIPVNMDVVASYLVGSKKAKFFAKLVSDAKTPPSISPDVLTNMSTKLGNGFRPVLEHLIQSLDSNYVGDDAVKYNNYSFDPNILSSRLQTLVTMADPFKSQKYKFTGKATLKDYFKLVNEIKNKHLKLARKANKLRIAAKEKEKLKPVIEKYYENRELAIREFYRNTFDAEAIPQIQEASERIAKSILEEQKFTSLKPAGVTTQQDELDFYQKTYEDWYEIMFEKSIKIALSRAKSKGHETIYLPTYESMKVVENSHATGMIYATPQEDIDAVLERRINKRGKFTMPGEEGKTYFMQVFEGPGDLDSLYAYYDNQGKVTKEEFDAAKEEYIKAKRVGPFYAALSKVKGIEIQGLETPPGAKKQFLKVSLKNYQAGRLERFRAIGTELAKENAYGDLSNDRLIEEKLAEDFRAYMLSGGKVTPKDPTIKSFFARLWQMIKNLLGMKSPIERLFKDLASGQLNPEQRARLQKLKLTGDMQEKYRLLPGFKRYIQQEEAILATAHQVFDYAREHADETGKDILELLASQKNLELYFKKTKQKFTEDYTRILATAELSREDKVRKATYEAMGIGESKRWEDTPKEDTANKLQPEIGFKSMVIRSMTKFGFRVNLKQNTIESEPLTEEGDLGENEELDRLVSEDEQDKVHDIEHTLINPIDGLSVRMKLFLATIPEPETNERDEITGEKKTVFGTPKYIDFTTAYSNLASKLSNSEIPLVKLEEIAGKHPINQAIFNRISSEIQAGNTRLQSEFNTKFNLTTYVYNSSIHGYSKEKGYYAENFETNRAGLKKNILNDWKQQSIRKKLIESSGKVVMGKAAALKRRMDKLAAVDPKTLTYPDLKVQFISFLKEIGIVLPEKYWKDLEGYNKEAFQLAKLKRLMFGLRSSSMQNFIDLASKGTDPYTQSGILNILAGEIQDYITDVKGSQFLNEFKKQVYATNTPSYITEEINKLRDRNYIDNLQKDAFLATNRFLNLLKAQSVQDKLTLEFISADREGDRVAKDFASRTPQASLIARFNYYLNTQVRTANEVGAQPSKTGKIFVGTFSDKTKQAVIGLPKIAGVKQSLNALTAVLRDTANQEAQRIQKIRQYSDSIPELEAYQRGDQFVYIPGLNEIENAAASLTEGELTPEEFKELDKQINEVIKKQIEEEYDQFVKSLLANGVISTNAKGELVNAKIPEAIVRTTPLNTFLKEFFYNDTLYRIETAKVFMGDAALYKSTNDYYKRQYQLVTPGVKVFNNPDKPVSLRRAIFRRVIKRNTADYLNSLKALIPNSRDKAIVDAYNEVNKTDAQSVTTIHGARKLMQAWGTWTKEHEMLYDFAWKDNKTINEAAKEKGTPAEEKTRLKKLAARNPIQAFKPFQFNNREVILPDGSTIIIKEQFKDSIAVLNPEWVRRHTEYTKLLGYMIDNNIDVMSSDDAVKVGKYGVIESLDVPLDPSYQVRTVTLDQIRFPQTIPNKAKHKISGSQFNKKITSNIVLDGEYQVGSKTMKGSELIALWNKMWEVKISEDAKELMESLGLKEDYTLSDVPSVRAEQLLTIKTRLEQELLSRDLNENFADALELVKKGAEQVDFNLHLGFPTHSTKFSSLLTNLFKKGILRQTLPGQAMVNLADFGLAPVELNKDGKPEIKENSNLNYITNKDGEIVEAEIGLSIDFFNNIGINYIEQVDQRTHKIRWEKLNENQKKALQMILYRIPTSDKSSMTPVRVAILLPPGSGNIVMIPGELTTQQGLDFDVDKSQLFQRVLDDKGLIDETSPVNVIFDIAWGVLTSPYHIAEVMTPLNSSTLESIRENYKKYDDPLGEGKIVNEETSGHFLTTTVDVVMENKYKHAKAMIGIFSRLGTAHDMLQTLAKDGYVKVSPNAYINIEPEKGPRFTELGRLTDDKGVLITRNISEDQSAALDAANNPLLSDLNVITVTSPVKGFLLMMGVNQQTASDFIMQPVIREWVKMYNKEGGSSEGLATEALYNKYPKLKNKVNDVRDKRLSVRLNSNGLFKSLITPIDSNLDQQAQVFSDFLRYLDNSKALTTVANVLSVDTFTDLSGTEALQSITNQLGDATSNKSDIFLSRSLFSQKDAPPVARRLTTFYNKGIFDAMQLAQQFVPYTNKSYVDAQDYIAWAIGKKSLNKEELIKVNNFLDLYLMAAKGLIGPTFNRIAPNSTDRWSFFEDSRSIWKHIEELIQKYPTLKNNGLIEALQDHSYNSKGVKMIGVANTNKNSNKTRMTQGWWNLLTSPNKEVQTLGVDLVKFAVYTSGFDYNTRSFIDLVPVQFWNETGLAEAHRTLIAGLLPNEEGVTATRVDAEAASRSFIRHNFSQLTRLPEVYFRKDDKWGLPEIDASGDHITSFTLPKEHPLMKPGQDDALTPKFVKHWDSDAGKYRLYEMSPDNKYKFVELQPLGEPGAFLEITYDGKNKSRHPANQNSGSADPFFGGPKITRREVPLDSISVPVSLPLTEPMAYNMPAKENILNRDTSTFNLIKEGLRTSTTRGYWYNVVKGKLPISDLVGKIVTFTSPKNEKVQVVISSVHRITKEDRANPDFLKQWEESEKWTKEHLLEKTKVGEYQVKFQLYKPKKGPSSTILPLLGGTGENPYIGKYFQDEVTSIETTLDRLDEAESDVINKQVIQKLKQNVNKINTPIQKTVVDGAVGVFQTDGESSVIKMNPDAKVDSDQMFRTVILHEINHAYSAAVLQNPTTDLEVNFNRNVERLTQEARKKLGNVPGTENKFEFIATLASDPAFRVKLQSKGLWSRILRFFRKLLGMNPDFDQILDQYYQVLDESVSLQNFDKTELFVKERPTKKKRLGILERMLAHLDARASRLRKQGKRKEAKALEKEIGVLRDLAKTKKSQTLVRYLLLVDGELEELKKSYNIMRANPDKINPEALWGMIEQLLSYDTLNSLSRQLRDNPAEYAPTEKAAETLIKQFDNIKAEVSKLLEDAKKLRIRRAAEIVMQNSSDPNLKLTDVIEQLEIADKDISWGNRLFDAGIDTADPVIVAMHKIIRDAQAEADRKTNEDTFRKTPKKTKVKYEFFEEFDEPSLTDPNAFQVAYRSLNYEFNSVGLAKANEEYEAWAKKNRISIGSVLDKNAPILDKKSFRKDSEGVRFIAPNSTEGRRILAIKKDSPDYPLRQYYENVVLAYLKHQEGIKQVGLRPGLRIPTIQRGVMEAVTSNGLKGFTVIGEQLADTVRRRYDETEFQAVTESGKPLDYLPIRFISKQDGQDGRISTREVSLDVVSTVGIFGSEMNRYREMEKILPDLELIKGQLKDRDVIKATRRTDYWGLGGWLTRERLAKSDPETGLLESIPGEESNSYKLADTLMRRLVYGHFKKDAGQVKIFGKKIDIRKSVDSFVRLTGLRILLGNIAIPLTNMAMGELTIMKEAIGGNFITMSEWKAGQKLSISEAIPNLADLGRREKKTKIGRVFMYFNPMENSRPIDSLGVDTNWMRTILPKITRSPGDMAEYKMATTALGATMARLNAVDSKGNNVSLYEAIEIKMDGTVNLQKGYTYKGSNQLSTKDINEVRDYTLRLYQFMNGIYNKIDSPAIKESVAGELLMFMRNWLVPGINTRWQTKRYDERFKKEIEGHYISALVAFNNFFHPEKGWVSGMVQSLRTLTWMGASDPETLLHPNELDLSEEAKNELIEMRKANIRKTLVELYLVVGLTMLLFSGWADDNDDNYGLYMAARIRRELLTFVSPTTAWDVLRSPSVALRTIEDFQKLIWHGVDASGALLTGEPLERYKSGPGKDQIKVLHDLKPIISINQFDDMERKLRLITRGGWR